MKIWRPYVKRSSRYARNIAFFFIFDRKNGGHLEFWKVFQFFFQKAHLDPRQVIMWKFEGSTSNGLVATRGTNMNTYKDNHKVNNRKNLFQQSWLLHTLIMKWLLRFPIITSTSQCFSGNRIYTKKSPKCFSLNIIGLPASTTYKYF